MRNTVKGSVIRDQGPESNDSRKKFFLTLTPCLLSLVILTSCTATDFRKAVGIQKSPPDEFMVEPRAKLKIPESALALPSPQKKADRALQAGISGREAVYGEIAADNRPKTAAENAILAKTGAGDTTPEIRRTVEKEYRSKEGVFGTKRGSTMEAILDPFGYNKPVDPIVNAKEENKRIKDALAKGEKVDPNAVKDFNPKKDELKEEGIF